MDTFLSIDLDYFNAAPVVLHEVFSCRPVHICMHHHSLLNLVRGAASIVNVDYHDDLSIVPVYPVACSNWVGAIRDKQCRTYTWVYPSSECVSNHLGICDYVYGSDSKNNEVWGHPNKGGWLNLVRCFTKYYEEFVPWDEVVSVGIAISPSFLTRWALHTVAPIMLNVIGKSNVRCERQVEKFFQQEMRRKHIEDRRGE